MLILLGKRSLHLIYLSRHFGVDLCLYDVRIHHLAVVKGNILSSILGNVSRISLRIVCGSPLDCIDLETNVLVPTTQSYQGSLLMKSRLSIHLVVVSSNLLNLALNFRLCVTSRDINLHRDVKRLNLTHLWEISITL